MTLRTGLFSLLLLGSAGAAPTTPRPSGALATLLAEDWEYHLSRSPT